jgi:hypothetical protein
MAGCVRGACGVPTGCLRGAALGFPSKCIRGQQITSVLVPLLAIHLSHVMKLPITTECTTHSCPRHSHILFAPNTTTCLPLPPPYTRPALPLPTRQVTSAPA